MKKGRWNPKETKRDYFKISKGEPFETATELLNMSSMSFVWYEPEEGGIKALLPRLYFDMLAFWKTREWIEKRSVYRVVIEVPTDDVDGGEKSQCMTL